MTEEVETAAVVVHAQNLFQGKVVAFERSHTNALVTIELDRSTTMKLTVSLIPSPSEADYQMGDDIHILTAVPMGFRVKP